MYKSLNTYWLTQKKFATPTLTPVQLKSVYRPHNHILRSLVGGTKFNLALLFAYLHFPLVPLAE